MIPTHSLWLLLSPTLYSCRAKNGVVVWWVYYSSDDKLPTLLPAIAHNDPKNGNEEMTAEKNADIKEPAAELQT